MRANRIKQIRQLRGMSQIELADKAEVAVNSIYVYESHHSMPSAPVIYRMAKALGVTAEELMNWEDLSSPQMQKNEQEPMAWSCSHCKTRNWITVSEIRKYDDYRKKGGDNDWMYLRCHNPSCAKLSRVVMGENISYYVKEVY